MNPRSRRPDPEDWPPRQRERYRQDTPPDRPRLDLLDSVWYAVWAIFGVVLWLLLLSWIA